MKKRITLRDLKKMYGEEKYYNTPNDFGKEGEDHINISIQSETRIGKVCDPAYLKVINYPYVGKFNSVSSLWYWVRSENLDDNIRNLTGAKLKAYADQANLHTNYVPNFKAIIAYATWLKIRSYPDVIKAIKNLDDDIKLLSYHVVKSSGLRVRTRYADLMISICDELFKAIKEDREPDFSKFVTDPDKAGLCFMEGVLDKILTEEKIEELKAQEKERLEHRNKKFEDQEEDYEEVSEEEASSEEETSEETQSVTA